MADEEVTPSLTEVLEQHQLTDTPTWACERVCSCGENVHTLIRHRGHAAHVASVLQASFVVLPKDQLHQEIGSNMIKALADENIALKHLVIAMGGGYCACDQCAPTDAAKAERAALNRASLGSRRPATDSKEKP